MTSGSNNKDLNEVDSPVWFPVLNKAVQIKYITGSGEICDF